VTEAVGYTDRVRQIDERQRMDLSIRFVISAEIQNTAITREHFQTDT